MKRPLSETKIAFGPIISAIRKSPAVESPVNPSREADEDSWISAPFWVTGLILAVIGLVGSAIGIVPTTEITDSHNVWIEYVSVGLLFPLVALALVHSENRGYVLRTVFAGLAFFYALCYALQVKQWISLGLGLIAIGCSWPALRAISRQVSSRRAAFGLAVALSAIGGWAVASQLSYVEALSAWIFGGTAYTYPPVAIAVFLIATIAVTVALFDVEIPWATPAPRIAMRVLDGLMIGIILLAACRRDVNFGDNHHVSFFIGPVEMIRQGGWLLWDVPSQYGFGNMLAMAALPVGSSYAAVFILNAVLLFLCATAIYVVLRLGTKSLVGPIFACSVAVGSTFFMAGIYEHSFGPERYPSVGAMRFFWCYVLGALLLATYLKRGNERVIRGLLVAGSVCWALSALWSAESAIYGSCIWFIPAAIITWTSRGISKVSRVILSLLPVAVVGAALLIIEAVYIFALGHGPDWRGFVDYGLSYENGFAAWPLSTLGDVWVLVLCFGTLCTIALLLIKWRRFHAAAVAVAACGMQWATASYFVMRSHPNNVLNLMAVNVFALGLALFVASKEQVPQSMLMVLRTSIAPIFIMIVALSFSATGGLAHYVSPLQPQSPKHLRDVLIDATPQSIAMYQRLGLKPDSPILYGSENVARVWPGMHNVMPRIWMPSYPPALLEVLSRERALVYINRFVDRRPMKGYMMKYTDASIDYTSRLESLLSARYDRKVVGVDGNLQLEEFIVRSKGAEPKRR